MNQEKIGKFILQCRKELKMTQLELANKIGVTDKAISKWENGRCLMDISLLKPLSNALNISVVELINGEKIEQNNVYTKSSEVVENTLNYANEKIKKNKIKNFIVISISIFLIITFSFILYKGTQLYKYNVGKSDNYEEMVNGLSFDKTMTIYKRTIDEDAYLIEDDIKIRNDFSTYTRTEKLGIYDSVKYNLDDKENNIKESFFLGVTENYINLFTEESIITFADKGHADLTDADRKYFLLKNDINNDVDFLKYIKNNYHLKSNLFTNTRSLKENYAFNMFVEIAIPVVESTTLINGDYLGYIFNLKNNIKQVTILRNDKSYVFTFAGAKFTDSYIQDLLSTLEIK